MSRTQSLETDVYRSGQLWAPASLFDTIPMRSIFPPLTRPVWPRPQESIGEAFGFCKDFNLLYWEAIGPALEAYNQVRPRIQEILAEKQGPLPNSDIIWFGLYMVGPDAENAKPHVMFAGENKSARKKATNFIKESRILDSHPGMHVGQWKEPPHIGTQVLRAGPSTSDLFRRLRSAPKSTRDYSDDYDREYNYDREHSDDDLGTWSRPVVSRIYKELVDTSSYSSTGSDTVDQVDLTTNLISVPDRIDFKQFTNCGRQSTVLEIHSSRGSFHATSGLCWKFQGAEYCLAPAHVFFGPQYQARRGDPESDSCSSDYEFDGFGDNETPEISYVDPSGGVSSSVPRPIRKRYEMYERQRNTAQRSDRSSYTREYEDERHGRRHWGEHSAHISNVWPGTSKSMAGSPFHYYTISAQLDYVLHILPSENLPGPAHGMQILTPDVIVEPTRGGSPAQVHTSHGLLSGVIKKTGAFVLLPHSTSYQEVFTAQLDLPVLAGDSGAVVSNESGQVYGHVVSSSLKSVAFVIPLRLVYEDIEKASQRHTMQSMQKGPVKFSEATSTTTFPGSSSAPERTDDYTRQEPIPLSVGEDD